MKLSCNHTMDAQEIFYLYQIATKHCLANKTIDTQLCGTLQGVTQQNCKSCRFSQAESQHKLVCLSKGVNLLMKSCEKK